MFAYEAAHVNKHKRNERDTAASKVEMNYHQPDQLSTLLNYFAVIY